MGNIQRKNLAKVPCKTEYNPIRPFVEKMDGLSFCQRSLPLRTWLKICSTSQLKCYIAAGVSLIDGYAHLDYDPKYPRRRRWRQGLLCRRAGVLKANGKSPKAKIDEIWTEKRPEQSELCSGNVADRVGFEPTSRLRDYLISSLVRTWYFRVCRGRWRQFWKRRKPLCCNGFRTRRPVLISSISEKTRVQIEMRNAPKRSIFLRAGKKTRKKKTLVRYGFADSSPD